MSTPNYLRIHVTWTIPVENLPEFYAILRTLFEHLIQEKECIYFNAFEIRGQPGVIRLVEVFDGDEAWLKEVTHHLSFCCVGSRYARKVTQAGLKIIC